MSGYLQEHLSSVLVIFCSRFFASVIGLEPVFDVPIVNVTVVKGQTAVLPCSIDHLGKFKVAWLDHNSIPLTYEDRRVVDDTRFSVIRPYPKEWNMQIRDIKWDDEGQYRCTINTNPVKNKLIMLHVKVPPEIIDELSSAEVTVQEGDTVTLTCNVTGVPLPHVTWQRKSVMNKALSVKETKNCRHRTTGPELGAMGMTLMIEKVTRQCDDLYECTANNGVPPTVTRQIRLTVEFAPNIQMPNRRIGQSKGRETILECAITAFPQVSNFWEKDRKRITSSMKHRLEAYDEGDHTLTLSLRIQITDASDFGEYKCVAQNSHGQDEEAMILYEYSESSESRRAASVTTSPPGGIQRNLSRAAVKGGGGGGGGAGSGAGGNRSTHQRMDGGGGGGDPFAPAPTPGGGGRALYTSMVVRSEDKNEPAIHRIVGSRPANAISGQQSLRSAVYWPHWMALSLASISTAFVVIAKLHLSSELL